MKNIIALFSMFMIIWSAQGLALGLGKETLHSALGEKLFMELPINGIGNYNHEQLRFSIASIERYQKMGVEFRHDHQQLKFSILEDDKGRFTLLITSAKPIKEPFLNFIIDMESPSGQLFKEVSILLDTPQ